MLSKPALDPIISQVDRRNYPHNKTSQKIVPILLNPKRSPLTFKKEAFFLISNYRGGDCGASFTASVEDFARGWKLELQVDYKVRCGEGNFASLADRIAEQLYDPAGPQAKLESIIRSWIEHFVTQISGAAEFLLNFYAHRDPLTQSIRKWAQEQLGLDLRPTISLNTDTVVKDTISIPPFVSKVICRDYDKEIDLQVGPIALDLDPSPNKAIHAHIRQRDTAKLSDILDKVIRDTVRSSFNLQQFRRESLPVEVRPKLKDALNQALVEHGRVVRALELKCDALVLNAEASYTSPVFTFTAKIPDYSTEANVECYLQMSLTNLGLFATLNIESPPHDWARTLLQSLIVDRFSRHTYVELMKEWADERRAIDEDLAARATSIGYEWKHTFIKTDLPFDLASRTQEMIVHEKQLTTKNSQSKVTLEGKIEYRVVDLRTLAKKYASETNIKARVEDFIRRTLQRFAGEKWPKQWNLHFDSKPGERALKDELFDQLDRDLFDEFGGRIESMTLKPDGELMRILDALREQAPVLSSIARNGVCTHPEFTVTRAHYAAELSYRVVDVIDEVWDRFEATKPTVEEVSKRIILHTRQILADEDPIQFRKLSHREVLARLNGDTLLPGLQAWIKNQFGLRIYIDHWVRQTTDIEIQTDDTRKGMEVAAIGTQADFLADLALLREEKEKIRSRILTLADNPDMYGDEIGGLKARLTKIDTEINQMASPDRLKQILAEQTDMAQHDLARSLGPAQTPLLKAPPKEDQEGGATD
jgi:hypothetical protein